MTEQSNDLAGEHASEAPPVLTERRGQLGLLTLNRPAALNALTHEMVAIITAALVAWRDDPAVATVAVVGAGERGLCAGGDIVALYTDATAGDGSASAAFWAAEYAMNAMIADYPKPVVAIQDGIVLGGGIGVSAHGSHRIVTERSKLGFPEVNIGYVPDVGASWLLSRAPGETGTRIALTAETVGAADAILVGLADAFVPAAALPALLAALESERAHTAVTRYAEPAPAGNFASERGWIDAAFAGDSILEILAALRASGIARAQQLADTIDAKSPVALAVTLAGLRRATRLSGVRAALETEYRVSLHALGSHDFVEGIRAQVIEKDRNPRWQPARHADVTAAAVSAYFAVPATGPLGLGAR